MSIISALIILHSFFFVYKIIHSCSSYVTLLLVIPCIFSLMHILFGNSFMLKSSYAWILINLISSSFCSYPQFRVFEIVSFHFFTLHTVSSLYVWNTISASRQMEITQLNYILFSANHDYIRRIMCSHLDAHCSANGNT